MKFLMLAALLLFAGCAYKPCTNTFQTIWEPTVIARCEHQDSCRGEQNLIIDFKEKEAVIVSVTTRYRGGSSDLVWYKSATNKLYLKCMFPEGLHNEMIGVKILVAYKGRVFEVPIYIMVQAQYSGRP